MMLAKTIKTHSLEERWYGVSLVGYREHGQTYAGAALAPEIAAELDGTLDWLRAYPPLAEMRDERSEIDQHLERLLAEVGRRGFSVPPLFSEFMRSQDLRDRVCSCTYCYWDCAETLVAVPPLDGVLLRFLNDQQWCMLWYLHLRPDGSHQVLVTAYPFDVEDELLGPEERATERVLCLCARSFEEFLYRFAIENSCWYSIRNGVTPIPREQRYLLGLKK